MRKLLLATTAIVGFAGAAQAAEAPIQVELGGSVDFRAALMHESRKNNPATTGQRRGDFQTKYEINIAAEGKSAGGIEYGALINLDNDQDRDAQEATMDEAYVWLSGEYGKLILGDEAGSSQMFVAAPTIGLGQVDGEYTDFTSARLLADLDMMYIDSEESDTKITYYTPKFGNDNHKVQLGVSFTPTTGAQGTTVSSYDAANGYKNVVELAGAYEGQFDNVGVALTPMVVIADGMGDKTASSQTSTRDYTLWGIGSQVSYADFTVGGSYVDAGHVNTSGRTGDDNYQGVWTFGISYDGFENLELAASYLEGKGFFSVANTARNYVDSYKAYGFGAAYTWFPGMTSAADAVFYDQNHKVSSRNNIGYVMMFSQKMSF